MTGGVGRGISDGAPYPIYAALMAASREAGIREGTGEIMWSQQYGHLAGVFRGHTCAKAQRRSQHG